MLTGIRPEPLRPARPDRRPGVQGVVPPEQRHPAGACRVLRPGQNVMRGPGMGRSLYSLTSINIFDESALTFDI